MDAVDTYAESILDLITALFKYGSTSMLAMQLLNGMKKKFDFDVTITSSIVTLYFPEKKETFFRTLRQGFDIGNLSKLFQHVLKFNGRASPASTNSIKETTTNAMLSTAENEGLLFSHLDSPTETSSNLPPAVPTIPTTDKSIFTNNIRNGIGQDASSIQLLTTTIEMEQETSRTDNSATLPREPSIMEEFVPIDTGGGNTKLYRFFAIIAAVISAIPAFGGSTLDYLAGVPVGTIHALLVVLSENVRLFDPFHVFFSAFLCGLATFIICYFFPKVAFWTTFCASGIWNLPGFILVLGAIEIISFGSNRGSIGITYFVKGISDGFAMALGVSLALVVGKKIFKGHPVDLLLASNLFQFPVGITLVICTVFLPIAGVFLMGGYWSQVFWTMIPTAACVFVLVGLMGRKVPDQICEFLAAFTVGIVSHIISLFTKNPYIIYVYTAMIPLVPGAGFVKSTYGVIEAVLFTDRLAANPIQSPYPPLVSPIATAFIVAYGIVISDVLFTSAADFIHIHSTGAFECFTAQCDLVRSLFN